MYLLDTNAWVVHLRTRGRSKLSQRLRGTPSSSLATCSIVRAELLLGAWKSPNPTSDIADLNALLNPLKPFAFDDRAADEYARIRAGLERVGMPIGGNDYIVASIALVHGLTVVTHNTGEYSRVPGLLLDDWQ